MNLIIYIYRDEFTYIYIDEITYIYIYTHICSIRVKIPHKRNRRHFNIVIVVFGLISGAVDSGQNLQARRSTSLAKAPPEQTVAPPPSAEVGGVIPSIGPSRQLCIRFGVMGLEIVFTGWGAGGHLTKCFWGWVVFLSIPRFIHIFEDCWK